MYFVRGEIVELAWQQKPAIHCFHIVVSCWMVAEVLQEATFTDVTLPPSRLLLLRRCKRGFWLHKTEINVENRSKQLTFSRTSLFNLLHCRLSEKGAMVLVQIITKYLLISLECRPHARKDANRIYTFISAGISVSNGSSINQVLNVFTTLSCQL